MGHVRIGYGVVTNKIAYLYLIRFRLSTIRYILYANIYYQHI